jgi:hypothetical protein
MTFITERRWNMVSSGEIEKEYRLEVKSKKLAASGVHHKTGKRGIYPKRDKLIAKPE